MEREHEDLKFMASTDYTDIVCKKCNHGVVMKFLRVGPPEWVAKCQNPECENHKPFKVKMSMDTIQNVIPHKELGPEVWE